MMEVGSRRLVHVNVTSHPTAAWTLQQFREVLASPHAYRFVLHDRDSIYAPELDAAVAAMGVRVLLTPVQAPKAVCERPLGSLRRECLDFLIPVGEAHLRRILRAWRIHYNRGRPHASLGPGFPHPRSPALGFRVTRGSWPTDSGRAPSRGRLGEASGVIEWRFLRRTGVGWRGLSDHRPGKAQHQGTIGSAGQRRENLSTLKELPPLLQFASQGVPATPTAHDR
jgi:hypothetical protein